MPIVFSARTVEKARVEVKVIRFIYNCQGVGHHLVVNSAIEDNDQHCQALLIHKKSIIVWSTRKVS
jgi:hypothetical protein